MTFKEKTFDLIGNNQKIFDDLNIYVDLIEEKNKLFNLTGFKGDVIWKEGIYQSIILMNSAFSKTENKKMLDIGSGVGFPSIPFLIYKRNFSLFISEPNKKRVTFLSQLKEKLSLNIEFIVQRIEDYEEENKFDLITARAVTSLKNLIEISSKVGMLNAEYCFLKGPKIFEELSESSWIIENLSIKPEIQEIQINLDIKSTQIHYLFKYIKTIRTPSEFPRSWLLISGK